MENHHCSWEHQLFVWPFSIAFCMFKPEGIDYIYRYIYHIYHKPMNTIDIYRYIWVNYNDLTTTSLEIMVSKGNHHQMALIQVSELL